MAPKKQRKPSPLGAKMIVIVPGIAIPEYMGFLLDYCRPTGYTRRAVEKGHLLLIDYHPDHVELECDNVEDVARIAREKGLRVYRGKRHVTVTDGVYRVRLYRESRDDGG